MKKIIKKIINLFSNRKNQALAEKRQRKELENKAIEGAKKAVTEYRRVFERLAEYDRT